MVRHVDGRTARRGRRRTAVGRRAGVVGNVPATRAILDDSATNVGNTTCGGTNDDNNVWGEGKLNVLAAYELAQGQQFTSTPAPVIRAIDPVVGGAMVVDPAPVWDPEATFTYQWRRDGKMISGATSFLYLTQPADLDARLTVTVVGSADGYLPTAVTSEPSEPIGIGDLASSEPTISPTAKVGTTLYAKSGEWTSGTTFTYQWFADGAPISGATAFTFVPTSTHRGKQLTVTITGERAGYVSETRTSPAVTVDYGVFSMPTPRISGSPTRAPPSRRSHHRPRRRAPPPPTSGRSTARTSPVRRARRSGSRRRTWAASSP